MRRIAVLGLLTFAAFCLSATALAVEPTDPGGSFYDDDESVFEGAIEAILAADITNGCTPRQRYCPDNSVTRGQMAAFIARTLNLPSTEEDFFEDDNGTVFEPAINKIAAAGITRGCNPPANNNYCPDRGITRAQMATFMVKAFQLPEATTTDKFTDDDESAHQANIDRLAESGITKGCNPPDNTLFCPQSSVSRGQMAAFLIRAIPLDPIQPPPRPPTHLVSKFTTYHSCCEPRVSNIHVMARQVDEAVVLPWETFDLNEFLGPRTTSKGYVPAPILLNGQGYCCDHPLNIGGGTSQFGTTIYNAIFWGAYDDVVHKPHSRYIGRYPLGIEATLGWKTPNVVFINDTWTPVIIRTSYTSSSITVSFWGNNGDRTVSGRHSGGRTTITVTKSGDETARHVTAKVTGSATYENGGTVTIKRTIAGPEGTHTETWVHRYIGE